MARLLSVNVGMPKDVPWQGDTDNAEAGLSRCALQPGPGCFSRRRSR
ncbi:hypothetical protein ABT215_22125 [Streptomyces sp900105755]